MADHHDTGPAELGAEMDYPEHTRTYSGFLTATKWGVIVCVALLVAMAFSFFTSASWISGIFLFFLLIAIAFFLA
jgi:hypothetical protein